MNANRLVSMRSRVVAPAALAGLALGRCQTGAALDLPQYLQRDHLGEMLALVPASAAGPDDNPMIATFADIAAQLAAGDIDRPSSVEDDDGMTPWIHASYSLAIADPIRTRALTITRDLLGYDVTDVDQTLEAGMPPEMVTLFRGRFDEAAVAVAWEINGYKMLEVDGTPVASLFEDAEIDMESQISQIALARMNNAAFLPDGTLAYTASLALMEQVIATAKGDADSLGEREDVAALLASLDEPLVSAIFFSGDAISAAEQISPRLTSEQADEIATQIADPEPMPPVALGLVGVTAGGPTLIYEEGEEPLIELPPATIVYRLLMAEPGTAETAAEVVDARLNRMSSAVNGQPYAELFGTWEATAAADGSTLAIDLTPAEGRPISFWPQVLFARDLLFLAW